MCNWLVRNACFCEHSIIERIETGLKVGPLFKVLDLLLPGCVTLGKSLHTSETLFIHLHIRDWALLPLSGFPM